MVIIKKLRIQKGVTQQELAESIGVSQVCISQWESDVSNPSIEKLQKLANVFSCSIDVLLGREPTP